MPLSLEATDREKNRQIKSDLSLYSTCCHQIRSGQKNGQLSRLGVSAHAGRRIANRRSPPGHFLFHPLSLGEKDPFPFAILLCKTFGSLQMRPFVYVKRKHEPTCNVSRGMFLMCPDPKGSLRMQRESTDTIPS